MKKFWVLLLFGFSFLVRFLFFQLFLRNNPVQLAFDSGHYHRLALNVAEGKGFTNDDGSHHFYRLPGYSLFLACCYKLFGVHPVLALWVQMVIASVIPVLIFLLCGLLIPGCPVVAGVSALVAAIHPGFLIMAGLIMSETLFVLLFLLSLLFLLRGVLNCFVLAGIALGLASLVRPLGAEVLVVIILVMLLGRATVGSIATVCASWLAVVSIWLLRNFMLTGFLFLHTLSGPHLLNHGAARAVMMADGVSYETAKRQVVAQYQQELDAAAAQRQRPLQEIECSRIASAVATHVCWQHPLQTIKLGIANMLKTVLSLYSSELLFIDSGGQLPAYDSGRGVRAMLMRFVCPQVRNGWIVWVIYFEMLLHLLVLLGAIGCVCERWREPARGEEREPCSSVSNHTSELPIISLPFILLFVILSAVCGFARMRLPIEPFLIMLAMSFWINLMTRRRVE